VALALAFVASGRIAEFEQEETKGTERTEEEMNTVFSKSGPSRGDTPDKPRPPYAFPVIKRKEREEREGMKTREIDRMPHEMYWQRRALKAEEQLRRAEEKVVTNVSNRLMYRLGLAQCAAEERRNEVGDEIDRGLILLGELNKAGFKLLGKENKG
jgi:hypothetical protein